MKRISAAVLIISVLFSCHNNNSSADKNVTTTADTIPAPPKEDSATTLIRNVITPLVKSDLEMASSVRWMYITHITFQMISLKEYYSIEKKQLEKNAAASTNKDKTAKALAYLEKMTQESSAVADVYKVQFHLAAMLANTTKYDEDHTRYLRHDLTDLKVIFPN